MELLLLDLLHASSAFRRWLLAAVAADVAGVDADDGFLGAWHSVSTPNGESDLEAEWRCANGTRLSVLIEDKLAAEFQPDQGRRYRERAEGYRASGRAGATRLVLVGPAMYPARYPEGAAPFERHVSLEAVLAWCEGGALGGRSAHVAAFLNHALSRVAGRTRGRTAVASGAAGTATTDADGVAAPNGKPWFPEMHQFLNALLETRTVPPGGVIGTTNKTPGEWVFFDFPGEGGQQSVCPLASTRPLGGARAAGGPRGAAPRCGCTRG